MTDKEMTMEELKEENKELKKDNVWHSKRYKVGRVLFTTFFGLLGIISIKLLAVLASVGISRVLETTPQNLLAETLLNAIYFGSTWILFLIVFTYVISDIFDIFKEEIAEFFYRLEKAFSKEES